MDQYTETCEYPGCTLPGVLIANDAPLTSNEYAERYACGWHKTSIFTVEEV